MYHFTSFYAFYETEVIDSCTRHSNGEQNEIKEPTNRVEIKENGSCLFLILFTNAFFQFLLLKSSLFFLTDVHIISRGAALELHVAMRFLIIDIVIMKQRLVALILIFSKFNNFLLIGSFIFLFASLPHWPL